MTKKKQSEKNKHENHIIRKKANIKLRKSVCPYLEYR